MRKLDYIKDIIAENFYDSIIMRNLIGIILPKERILFQKRWGMPSVRNKTKSKESINTYTAFFQMVTYALWLHPHVWGFGSKPGMAQKEKPSFQNESSDKENIQLTIPSASFKVRSCHKLVTDNQLSWLLF